MKIEYVCLANNEQELRNNLMRSVDISDVNLTVVWGASSASKALHEAVKSSVSDFIVVLHQDVFLPPNWTESMKSKLFELDRMDSKWAVAGPLGKSKNLNKNVGQVWSSSLGAVVGSKLHANAEVESLDELALIINRKSQVNFDPELPDFHLYGADICLNAKKLGWRSYALQIPLVHNDKFKPGLGLGFLKSYFYMRKKWKAELPVSTPVTIIERDLLHILKGYFYLRVTKKKRRVSSRSHFQNPECYWNETSKVMAQ